MTRGWYRACEKCGTYIGPGVKHYCWDCGRAPGGAKTEFAQPPAVTQANPYELTLQRIAVALERIAAALTKEPIE